MSSTSVRSITCPRCKRQQNFTVWESVNVSVDPALKNKLLCGELNKSICAGCGHVTLILYSMLYHDMEKRLMIWFLPGEESLGSARATEKLLPFFKRRIVRSLEELFEKIRIFDLGLDDRVVEMLKANVNKQKSDDNRLDLSFCDIIHDKIDCNLNGTLEMGDSDKVLRFTSRIGAQTVYMMFSHFEWYLSAEMELTALLPKNEDGRWHRVDQLYIKYLRGEVSSHPDESEPISLLARILGAFGMHARQDAKTVG
jgi:hypothetical protein